MKMANISWFYHFHCEDLLFSHKLNNFGSKHSENITSYLKMSSLSLENCDMLAAWDGNVGAGPPCWSRLKYVDNEWMDYQKTVCSHSWSPKYYLNAPLTVPPEIQSMRLTFVFLNEMSQQILDGLSDHIIVIYVKYMLHVSYNRK